MKLLELELMDEGLKIDGRELGYWLDAAPVPLPSGRTIFITKPGPKNPTYGGWHIYLLRTHGGPDYEDFAKDNIIRRYANLDDITAQAVLLELLKDDHDEAR